MKQKRPEKVSPGDTISARDWNYLVDLICRNSIDVGSSPGLTMRQGPGGTGIALTRQYGQITPGVVLSPGISARVLNAPGKGQVELYAYDGTVLVDTGDAVTALSISSTTGGLPTDTYVMVGLDANGYWWVITADCGN